MSGRREGIWGSSIFSRQLNFLSVCFDPLESSLYILLPAVLLISFAYSSVGLGGGLLVYVLVYDPGIVILS